MRGFFTKAAKGNKHSAYSAAILNTGSELSVTDISYTSVSKQGYKRNWIIHRCLQEIARACSQIKFRVMKYNKDGELEELKGHPITQLLDKPNPLYSKSEFIKRAVIYRYIAGDAPIQRIKASGSVKELYVYRPDKVKIEPNLRDIDNPIKKVSYNNRLLPAEDILLWKEFDVLDEYDGMGRGSSMLSPVLRNGDLLNEFLDWNIALLQNGGNISGVFSTEQNLTEDEFTRGVEQIKAKYSGKNNSGKMALVSGGIKFIPTSTNPKDLDWTQGKKDSTTDICIGLGIDPIIIGLNESASYNNKNEAEKGLYTKTAIPLMQDLAESLQMFLGVQEGEILTIDYSEIPCLQEDMKEKAEIISKAADMTVNEKRAVRGLEPIEGGDVVVSGNNYAIVDGKLMLPMNLIELGEEDKEQPHNSYLGKKVEEGKSQDFWY